MGKSRGGEEVYLLVVYEGVSSVAGIDGNGRTFAALPDLPLLLRRMPRLAVVGVARDDLS